MGREESKASGDCAVFLHHPEQLLREPPGLSNPLSGFDLILPLEPKCQCGADSFVESS